MSKPGSGNRTSYSFMSKPGSGNRTRICLRHAAWYGEIRNQPVEFGQECSKPRIFAAGHALEAEFIPFQRAGQSNHADIRPGAGLRRVGLQRGEATLDLAALMRDPGRLVLFGRAEAAFIELENGGIGDAIRQGLQLQRGEPGRPGGGDHRVAACIMVQKLNDDAAVIHRGAVGQDQAGDFSEWVILPQRIGRVHRIGRKNLHLAGMAGEKGRHLDLAAEGRGGRRAQFEHRRFRLC